MTHHHAGAFVLAIGLGALVGGAALAGPSTRHRDGAHQADGRYTSLTSGEDATAIAPNRRGYPYVGYNVLDPSTYPAAGIDLPSPANLTPND